MMDIASMNLAELTEYIIGKGLPKFRAKQIYEWMNKKLILQLDHINGDNRDNRISNLRLLCPNCHSQTETYCKKNKK